MGSLINIIFGVFVRVLGALATFVAILILTNSLDKADNANYFLLISLSTFFSVVFRMGSDNLLIKNFAEYAENSFIDLSFIITLSLFIIFLSIICIFLIFLFVEDFLFWQYVIILSSITSLNIMFTCALNGLNKVTLSVFLSSTLPNISFLAAISLLQNFEYLNIENIYFISLVTNLFPLILSIITLKVLIAKREIGTTIKLLNIIEITKLSGSFFGGSVIQVLQNQLPILSLGMFSTNSQVALFGVASRLSSTLGYINTITSKYIALIYAKINNSSDISTAIKYITIFQVLTLIFFTIFADKILSIFGDSYEQAKAPTIFLISAQVLNLFLQNYVTRLQVTNKQNKAFLFLFFNLGLLILFLTLFNIISDQNSLNTSISVFLVLVISLLLVKVRKQV